MLMSLGLRSFRTVLLFRPGVAANLLSAPPLLRGRGILVPGAPGAPGDPGDPVAAVIGVVSLALKLDVVVPLWIGGLGLRLRVPGLELRVAGWEGQSSERSSSHIWDDMMRGAVELAVASRLMRIHEVKATGAVSMVLVRFVQ